MTEPLNREFQYRVVDALIDALQQVWEREAAHGDDSHAYLQFYLAHCALSDVMRMTVLTLRQLGVTPESILKPLHDVQRLAEADDCDAEHDRQLMNGRVHVRPSCVQ